MKARVLVCAVLAVAGCEKPAPAPAAPASAVASIVGRWESAPTLSQMGHLVHKYDFTADGRFTYAVDYIDAKLPTSGRSGTYDAAARTVQFEGAKRSPEMTYAFDGAMLVLTEPNGDSYRLNRK